MSSDLFSVVTSTLLATTSRTTVPMANEHACGSAIGCQYEGPCAQPLLGDFEGSRPRFRSPTTALAHVELEVRFRELGRRREFKEPADPLERFRSNFVGGKHMPTRLKMNTAKV